jgi:hypothetical protein
MQLLFTRSAQLVICCETCPKTKIKTTGSYWQAGRNAAHWQLKDLQAHREGVSVEIKFISPSLISRLMEKG